MRVFIILIIFCAPLFASAAVVINEIAWMGTSDSASNEWIELANTGDATNLTGWTLRIEGKKDIALSGTIATGGYYLIERTDDQTVPNVTADLIDPFGGFVDSGATLMLLDSVQKEQDRVNGSDGWKIGGGEVKGNKITKETAQRNGSGWITAVATPRATNSSVSVPTQEAGAVTTTQTSGNTSQGAATIAPNFSVEPQIFADAGSSLRTVVAGAPITFSGKVFGFKKEPIENARIAWSFGDGGSAEGQTVLHNYYYPGEYTVVLDASSGYYSASDRVRMIVVKPELVIQTGGDIVRSFITIDNKGSDEIDLSGWLVSVGNNTFVLPKNMLVGGRKVLTLPSEVTKLSAPEGSTAKLQYPNGTEVVLEKNVSSSSIAKPTPYVSGQVGSLLKKEVSVVRSAQHVAPLSLDGTTQEASVVGAVSEINKNSPSPTTIPKDESLWMWYTGTAFLGALALLGLRYARKEKEPDELSAEDFDIKEDF